MGAEEEDAVLEDIYVGLWETPTSISTLFYPFPKPSTLVFNSGPSFLINDT